MPSKTILEMAIAKFGRREVETFLKYADGVPDELLDAALYTAVLANSLQVAYDVVARHRAAPPVAEERREVRQLKLPMAPWQAATATLALLSPLHWILGIIALPFTILIPKLMPNYVPLYREDRYVIYKGKRLLAYEVTDLAKDVWGMLPNEFALLVTRYMRYVSGVVYRGGRLYLLIEEGREGESREMLRRLGIYISQQPTAVDLPARDKRFERLAWALALAPIAVAPLAPWTAAIAAFSALFTFMEPKGVPRRGVAKNLSITHDVEYQSLQMAVRSTAVREAVLAWERDEQYLVKLERAGSKTSWLSNVLMSTWKALQAELLHVSRRRLLENPIREDAYLVAGWFDGESIGLTQGRPKEVYALSLDLAEFSPYVLLPQPSQCREDSVVLGEDEKGRRYCWRPEDTQSPHVVVVGATGSGKTTVLMSIAKQLKRRGIHLVAIDPHAHWSHAVQHSIDARLYRPQVVLESDDADLVLDVLRAAGVQVYDLHYTVLLNAIDTCGGRAELGQLPECLKHVRSIENAWAIDSILGRLIDISRARPTALVPDAVVHVGGESSPSATMRMVLWLIAYVIHARSQCPRPPCPYRWFIVVDEAHRLLKNVAFLPSIWRELRKFGIVLSIATQSLRDVPVEILENSGLHLVLAVQQVAVPEVASVLHIDPRVAERVATTLVDVSAERYGLAIKEGRPPVYIRLLKL